MPFLGCRRALHAVAVLLLTAPAAIASELSHEQKARDWIDLGDYERARFELSQAINKVPKNVGARVILATSYIKESQARGRHTSRLVMYALDALRLVDLIEGSRSRSQSLRTEAYRRLAALYEQGDATDVIDVLRRFPAPEAAPLLAMMMASRDRQVAIAAETILQTLDAERTRRTLLDLLASPGQEIREHAAERLWQRERYDGARPLLRAKLSRELARQEYPAEAAKLVERLVELGYAEASDGLVDLLRKGVAGQAKIAAALAALEPLVANNDPRAGEIARSVIGFKSVKEASSGCHPTTLAFVRALGRLKGAENYAALKDAFSFLILVQFASCSERYQDAIAAHDGRPWRSMKTYYNRGGWPIFRTMIPGRIAEARARQKGYAADAWQLVSASAPAARDRLILLLERLGPYSLFGGGRPIAFIPLRVAFEDPGKARMTISMHDIGRSNAVSPQAAGRFTLVLEAVGTNPEQPWTVTAAEEGHLDGQKLF